MASESSSSASMTATTLFDLPPELVEHALIQTETPIEVAKFALTCRRAHAIVYGAPDQHLWRNLYLGTFDDPRESKVKAPYASSSSDSKPCLSKRSSEEIDWKRQLQRRIHASRIVGSAESTFARVGSRYQRILALETLVSVFNNSPPITIRNTGNSKDITWLETIFKTSNIFKFCVDRFVDKSNTPPNQSSSHERRTETLLLARIHVLLPLSQRSIFLSTSPSPSSQFSSIALNAITNRRRRILRTESRCFVYTLANYTSSTSYGPFALDGSGKVNWTHVAALQTVLLTNMERLDGRMAISRPPLEMEAMRAYSAPEVLDDRDSRDWAGVEGTWRNFICFMDYQ